MKALDLKYFILKDQLANIFSEDSSEAKNKDLMQKI